MFREFELLNTQNILYRMPTYFFSCGEFDDLTLAYCILKPPLKFGGFSDLKIVRPMDVIITADISSGPKLEQLFMQLCIGIKHLGCIFSKS